MMMRVKYSKYEILNANTTHHSREFVERCIDRREDIKVCLLQFLL